MLTTTMTTTITTTQPCEHLPAAYYVPDIVLNSLPVLIYLSHTNPIVNQLQS